MTSAVTSIAAGLGPADDLDRAGGGEVADVDAGADVLGEQDVPGDDRLLGHRGPPPEPELGGDDALVHLGALGQPRFLRVLGDDPAEGLHVLQGPAHDHGVVDALAVVGEHGDAGGRLVHGAELGELPALQADGDRADGLHVAVAVLLPEPVDLLDHAGGVGDGEGVRHGEDGRVAAGGRGARAGQHGLGVLAARLAQMRVQVDQARQQHLAVGLDDLGALGAQADAHLGDRGTVDQDVLRLAAEHLRTTDQDLAHVLTSPRWCGRG